MMYGPGVSGNGAAAFGGPGGGGRGGGGRFQRKPVNNAGNNRSPLADLPPMLVPMFESTEVLQYKPPPQLFIAGEKTSPPKYTGVAQYVQLFDPKGATNPQRLHFETPLERKIRLKQQTMLLHKEKNELLSADWDPHNNPKATENAYTTLFVGKLSYDTNEKKLRREFEQYGALRSVKVVKDLEGKSRGYAFVEFESEADMTTAYKRSDGKKIDGRRILVDVERGRTVRDWRPTRLGGGLGGRKETKSKQQLGEEAAREAVELERNARSAVYGGGGRDVAYRESSFRDSGSRDRDRNSRDNYRDSTRDRDRSRDDRSRDSERNRDGRRGGGSGRSRSRDRWERGVDPELSDRDERGSSGRDGGGRRGKGAEVPPPSSIYGGGGAGRDNYYRR